MWNSLDRTWGCGNVSPGEDTVSTTAGSAHFGVSSCPLVWVHLSFLRVWRLKIYQVSAVGKSCSPRGGTGREADDSSEAQVRGLCTGQEVSRCIAF
jgi:hypothetical protein